MVVCNPVLITVLSCLLCVQSNVVVFDIRGVVTEAFRPVMHAGLVGLCALAPDADKTTELL